MERTLPKNYQTVYQALRDAGPGQHLNAAELCLRLGTRAAHISQTTVYRALDRLVALGMIEAVHAPQARHVAYEITAPSHAHFHCRVCGALRDIPCPATALAQVPDLANLLVERTVVLFEGCCPACRVENV